MDLLDKIDAVLKVLYLESGNNPNLKSIQAKLDSSPIDIGETRDCIQKLYKDGFVKYEDEGAWVDYFHDWVQVLITFDGKFFYETVGGYKNKKLINAAENRRLAKLEVSQSKNASSLTFLTRWIALGTILGGLAALVAAWYYLCQLFPHCRICG